jgi:ABC-type dipeptide/oligopeptide/nickel transport system permease component
LAYRQQAAAVRLLRGERLIQRGKIALLDNPSDNLHHMMSPTIALGLPWAALLTQLVRASLLEPDVVYDRLRALGSLSIALRRALNAAGISVGAWNCATLCGNKRFP